METSSSRTLVQPWLAANKLVRCAQEILSLAEMHERDQKNKEVKEFLNFLKAHPKWHHVEHLPGTPNTLFTEERCPVGPTSVRALRSTKRPGNKLQHISL